MLSAKQGVQLTAAMSVVILSQATASSASTLVADWGFNVASAGEIGTAIASTTDSVSGLSATPHPSNTNAPVYSNGNPGGGLDASADFSAINGVLEVADPTGILTGHNDGRAGATAITIDVDVNMNTVTSSTWAIVRNGHQDGAIPGTAFNLFTQADGAVGFIVYGNAGSIQGRTDFGNILDPNAGWQHITASWDGTQVTISVDGVPQVLNGLTGDTFVAGDIGGNLRASDANMGIGGLRRSGDPGSIGQFLDGAIDNLQITLELPAPVLEGDINGDGFVGIADLNIVLGNWNAGTPPATGTPSIPEPASFALIALGGTAMLKRRG
jgi:hypothetical protein